MRGLITKECLVICFLVAVTLHLQWVDGSSEARQTRVFAKRANETHDHDHDPIAEILAILDENNDTLIDPEEFHEWFELIFPVLLEHEEGGGHSGHAHRRRNDNEAISSKESQRSSQRWKRSSIVHTQIVGAMRDQHRFASHSRSTPQSFPEGTPMEGLRAKRDAHCPLDEDLFAEFDEDASGFLNETEIGEVALEMMVMLLEGCNEEPEEEDDHCGPGDDWEYWLAGLASVFLVCILSLVGVVLIPCMGEAHRGWQAYMMMTMVAFAAGALFGDAIFHILPSIFGAHSHDHGGGHEHGGEEEEEKNEKEYLGLAALCMIGVLLFFIIEKMILFFIGKGHSHSLADDSDEEGEDMEKKSEEKDDDESSKDDEESSTSHSSDSEVEQGGSRINLVERLQNSYAKTKELGSGSVIVGSTKALKQQSINSVRRLKFVKSYGWLNLTADAFHNFIDGIAIGASYSQSLSLGISTTLAVIFHEIPQELGDYAMIVKAGFGKVFALGFNLFSALLAILGCLIGLGVGEAASSGDDWILAFTAGGFLYISLANMVPELHTYTRKRHWTGLVYILLQLSGFILGAGLLLLLAAFEEDISIGC